jgi:hypothetical protein
MGARALTAGTDILFRAGEYLPSTPGGDRLLAHELAHVVQQAHGLPQGILDTGATDHLEKAAGLAADHASPAAESEAHGAAMIAAMGEPVPALSRQPPTIARQDDVGDDAEPLGDIAGLCAARGIPCPSVHSHPFKPLIGRLTLCRKPFVPGPIKFYCIYRYPDGDECIYYNNLLAVCTSWIPGSVALGDPDTVIDLYDQATPASEE